MIVEMSYALLLNILATQIQTLVSETAELRPVNSVSMVVSEVCMKNSPRHFDHPPLIFTAGADLEES